MKVAIMVRRSSRGFIKKDQVLSKLRTGRDGAIQVHIEGKIGSAEYVAATKITDAIDDLAEILTGERDYFYALGFGDARAKENRP